MLIVFKIQRSFYQGFRVIQVQTAKHNISQLLLEWSHYALLLTLTLSIKGAADNLFIEKPFIHTFA